MLEPELALELELTLDLKLALELELPLELGCLGPRVHRLVPRGGGVIVAKGWWIGCGKMWCVVW